jgi:hypothetical protein
MATIIKAGTMIRAPHADVSCSTLKKRGITNEVRGARVPENKEMLTTDVNGESTGIVK